LVGPVAAEEQAKKDAAAKALREEMEAIDDKKAEKETEERIQQCRGTFSCADEHCKNTPRCQREREVVEANRKAAKEKAEADAKAAAEAKKSAKNKRPISPPSQDTDGRAKLTQSGVFTRDRCAKNVITSEA
jgi:membrane protein involved in colicin uptake